MPDPSPPPKKKKSQLPNRKSRKKDPRGEGNLPSEGRTHLLSLIGKTSTQALTGHATLRIKSRIATKTYKKGIQIFR